MNVWVPEQATRIRWPPLSTSAPGQADILEQFSQFADQRLVDIQHGHVHLPSLALDQRIRIASR